MTKKNTKKDSLETRLESDWAALEQTLQRLTDKDIGFTLSLTCCNTRGKHSVKVVSNLDEKSRNLLLSETLTQTIKTSWHKHAAQSSSTLGGEGV